MVYIAIKLPSKLPSLQTSHKWDHFTSVYCCSVYTIKALTSSRSFVQDWNQDIWFPVTAGSSHLNFSNRGTSDPFALIPNSTKLWGNATNMMESCLPFVDVDQASKVCEGIVLTLHRDCVRFYVTDTNPPSKYLTNIY